MNTFPEICSLEDLLTIFDSYRATSNYTTGKIFTGKILLDFQHEDNETYHLEMLSPRKNFLQPGKHICILLFVNQLSGNALIRYRHVNCV